MLDSIRVRDFGAEGISLTSPLDKKFDALVRSLFRGNTEELLKLKPFLVVVSNNTERTIVAYTLFWIIKRTRETKRIYAQYKYPDAVASLAPQRGNEIRSGEQKIVPLGIELNCGRFDGESTEEYYLRQFVDWFKEYADTVKLRIELDAVIFDDGELIGTDKSDLGTDYAAYVRAKQDLYRSITDSLDSGQSINEAFRTIETDVAANAENPMAYLHDLLDNPLAIYPREAAAEVRSWRLEYGDAALSSILKQALRKEPFLIRKRPFPEIRPNHFP